MDVVALGELLIDFTENGVSGQGNPLFEANPGGAPCNVLAMLSQPLEEWPYGGPGAAFADPQNLFALSIHDYGGIAMPLEQGKLIHEQEAHLTQIRFGHGSSESLLINGLQGMPVDAGELGDMLEWQQRHQRFEITLQSAGDP